jgi:2-phospho-L-lactate guanylyltransferase
MTVRYPLFIPVGRLSGAKSRLAPVLACQERAALVLDMLASVLDAARAAAVARAIVVTPDQQVADFAGRLGHHAIRAKGCGLNSDLRAALGWLDGRNRAGAVLMADLPDLDHEALNVALARVPRCGGLVASDQTGAGTSLLAWRELEAPPCFAFGPGSFGAHRRILEQRGDVALIDRDPTFRDLDQANDLGGRFGQMMEAAQ